MPLYEYECSSCKKTHEVMQKFSDPPLEKCPECGGPVTKLMSLSSFSLKGAGWYTTDYKKPAGAKPPEGKAPETKDTKTTEAKPTAAKPAEAKPAETKPGPKKSGD